MNLLLDSNILIDVLRKRRRSLTMLDLAVTAGHSLRTSTINVAEVYAGLRDVEAHGTSAFLGTIPAYDVTPAIAKRGGLLRNALLRKGKTRELDDMLVAATALEYGLQLVTENRKDFEGTGVTFYKENDI